VTAQKDERLRSSSITTNPATRHSTCVSKPRSSSNSAFTSAQPPAPRPRDRTCASATSVPGAARHPRFRRCQPAHTAAFPVSRPKHRKTAAKRRTSINHPEGCFTVAAVSDRWTTGSVAVCAGAQ
jgi:hypothetical protein